MHRSWYVIHIHRVVIMSNVIVFFWFHKIIKSNCFYQNVDFHLTQYARQLD